MARGIAGNLVHLVKEGPRGIPCWPEESKETGVSLIEVFKGDRFPLAEKKRNEQRGSHSAFSLWGRIQRNRAVSWQWDLRGTAFLLHRKSRGEAPRWLEESKETWVSWQGYPKGAEPPLAHDLACKV